MPWEGEPDGIVWSFELKENRILLIKAECYEDLDNKGISQSVIKTEYPYDDFLRNVVIEVDSLIKRHGIIGYREEWNESDFTLSTFLKLKHFIINKQKYPVQEVSEEFDVEIRSDLKYDLELLLQEIN